MSQDKIFFKKMHFLKHLSELRQHLCRIIIAIAIASLLIAFNMKNIIDNVFLTLTENDFITFKIINFITNFIDPNNQIIMPNPFPIQVRKMFEQVNIAISISLFGGIITTFPYLIFEIRKFIIPGLTLKEKKFFSLLLLSIICFFFLGILFGYFIVSPLSIYFGYFFNISNTNKIMINIDLSNYIQTICSICFGMGLLFLIPVISQFLTYIGILNPNFLKTYKRHAYVLILFIGALITPPDAISMILASFPLFLLYELSIFLSKKVYMKNMK